MRSSTKIAGILFLLFYSVIAYTQSPSQPAQADTLREFEIIKAPSMRAIKIDSVTTLQTVAGGAVIKQESTYFHSDSAVLNPVTHEIEAFGNIHINQGDTIHTYGEYLKYLGVEKMAYLKRKIKLTDGKGTLFTEDLDYNLESGIGNFYQGGKVIEKKTVITSREGTYYADTKDVYFKKDVLVQGPKDTINADSLLYNMQTKRTSFISETHIKNAEVDIHTTEGSYDLNSEDAFFTKRTTVTDSSGRIYSADNMALEGKSGNGQLEGNAVIIDSANNFVVLANQIFLNKKNNSFLATRRPLLIVQQKNDSTYIAADTIFSGLKGREMILNKDTVININLQQDEKISGLMDTDPDSVHRMPGPISNDTSDIKTDLSGVIKISDTLLSPVMKAGLPERLTDSTVIEAPPVMPDSLKSLLPSFSGKTNDTLLIDQKWDSISLPAQDSILPIGKDTELILKSDNSNNLLRPTKDTLAPADTIRYFLAFHQVRIFNDSLQSVCDSLFFSTEDSVFRLYKDPVIWNGQSQITGDTIYLFTKNKEAERLYAFENMMMVNKTKEGFYNQVSGKTLNAYFIQGKIDYARVRGSQAENVYYMQDEDSAYIGMNRASGDVIDFYFKEDDLIKVLFVNEIKGKIFPMNEIPEDQRELRNFKWLDARRPKSKFELY